MEVRVRVFATYREIVGRKEVAWPIREGMRLKDLVDGILAKHPGLARHRDTMLLAVNHEFADPSAALRDGDEVALMPPVSGG